MPAPESLGPYRITKTIGRGGMGTVYAAIDEDSGKPVAVKLIAQHVADEPRFRERFEAEIKTLHSLKHVGIVRFGHSHIDREGRIFYSMELVEGESLQAKIRRVKRMDWSETIDLAIQVCAALKHAHDSGVIHRDLKPANLVLTHEGDVKLVDFGIAKVFGDGNRTVEGSVLGTADYMAPEQADSTGITQRTDLYALGNVMYAMLTGRPPFTGKRVTEVIASLKRERPARLDLIDPDLPEELVELIHQLLEKEPADRPPTALVVMKRLQSMRAGLGRDHTVIADDVPTKVGPLREDDNDPDTTGIHPDSDSATSGEAEPTAHRRRRTVISEHGSDRTPVADPNQPTVVSHGSSRTVLPDGSIPTTPKHYEPVTDFHLQGVEEAPTSRVFHESVPTGSHWKHWVGVAAMVIALIFGGGLMIYAMLPPSADDLYETASQSGDAGAMKTFLRRFPNDPRYDEVLNLHMTSRLEGALRRLATQSKLGVKPLEASEEGFVKAMTDREQEPQNSIDQLQQWLDVYDDPANASDLKLKELIELARHEQTQLKGRAPAIIIDPRAEELLEAIQQTVENDPPEEVRKKLTAIINLHEGDSWARPAVQQAKSQLEELE